MCLFAKLQIGSAFGATAERLREDHSIPERHDHGGDHPDIQRKRGIPHRIYDIPYDHTEDYPQNGAAEHDGHTKAADHRAAPVGNDCSRRKRRPVMGDSSRYHPGGAAGAVLHQRIPP